MKKLLLLIAFLLPITASADQIFLSRNTTANAATFRLMLNASSPSSGNNANANGLMAIPGTFTGFSAWAVGAITGADSWTVSFQVNGVTMCTAEALTATKSATTATCNAPVVAGDKVQFLATISGTPNTTLAFAASFVPSNPNETQLFTTTAANLSAVNLQYAALSQSSNPIITEPTRVSSFPENGVLDLPFVGLNGAPGAGTSYIATLRQNGATSTPSCTIADANTTCTDTVNAVNITAGDYASIAAMPMNTPTVTRVGAGYRFMPSVPGRFLLLSNGATNQGTAQSTYLPLAGAVGLDTVANGASSTQYALPMVVKSISVHVNNAPGGSAFRKVTFVQNDKDVASCTITGAATDAVCAVAVYVGFGDRLYYRQDPSGSPVNSAIMIGTGAVPRFPGMLTLFKRLIIRGSIIMQ